MIQVVYSTQHWIVPRIVIGVLVILLLAIIITEGMARVKEGKPFLAKPGRFFIENADYVKLFGSLILFAGYVFCLEIIGFTVTSIIFVFLFNLLFAGTSKKSIIISVIISIVAALLISILFGVVFNITLPRGLCTLELTNFGITIY